MQDQSYALRKLWRSLSTLQTLITSGKHGNLSGVLKPLYSLKVDKLQTELSTRGIQGVKDMKKPELQEKLDSILEVPSLLTPNPTQSLFDINLEDYEILDCEPLYTI